MVLNLEAQGSFIHGEGCGLRTCHQKDCLSCGWEFSLSAWHPVGPSFLGVHLPVLSDYFLGRGTFTLLIHPKGDYSPSHHRSFLCPQSPILCVVEFTNICSISVGNYCARTSLIFPYISNTSLLRVGPVLGAAGGGEIFLLELGLWSGFHSNPALSFSWI